MEARVSHKIQYISFAMALSVIFIHTYNLEVYGLTAETGGSLCCGIWKII